MHLNIKNCTP